MEKASLLVLTELGKGGFESLLEHDSTAQPPLCILWYPSHTTSYKDGGRTMQMPLVSKFLCYLEAAARMELAGISSLHQIPFSNGCQRVSNGYRHGKGALNKFPGSLGGILLSYFCRLLLTSSKSKPSAAVAIS
jgi:hypothetical protein